MIVAKTIKGRGFSEVENKEGWHGKPLPPDMAARAIKELGGERHLVVRGPLPEKVADRPQSSATTASAADLPRYELGASVATRKAYGDALVAIGAADPRVVVLDAEVSNSTHADEFKQAFPDRYFEMFISEQQLVAAATGLSVRGYKTFASTFAAFFTRAFDFVRMGAISGVELRLSGSHCGVEIGADGPSQMGLEDLAMMRSVHGSTVLYPSDATSTAALVAAMAGHEGISYIRTTRGAYPVIYEAPEAFPVGGSKVVRSSERDDVTLVGAGVTLHECVQAAELLENEGVQARVIDCYSVKPIDAATVSEGGGRHVGTDRRGGGPPPRGRAGIGRDRIPRVERADRLPHRAPRRQGDAGLGHRGRAHGVGRHRRRPHRSRRPRARARRLSPARTVPRPSALTASPVDIGARHDRARRPAGR